MSPREFVTLSETEFETQLREAGFSEDVIANLLATFEEEQAKDRRFLASLTPTPTPRTWTAQELLNCDKTTLNRQLDGRALPGELLSECELAFYAAQLHLAAIAEDELTPSDHARLLEHLANLAEIHQEVASHLEPTYANVVYSCSLLPKWLSWIQAAEVHFESLGRTDLLAYEVEVLSNQVFINGIEETCQDVP